MITKKSYALFGVAGSGKTQTCFELIKEFLGKGYGFHQICFTTYTNAGIEAMLKKLETEDPPIVPTKENYFKTMHKICWKLCNYLPQQIMSENDKTIFCKKIMLPYNKNKEDEEEKSLGEYFFEFYEYIQNQKATKIENIKKEELQKLLLEKYAEEESLTALDVKQLVDATTDFVEWKKKHDKKMYSDALIEVLENQIDIPTKILIVDEAQDLYLLQEKIIRLWKDTYDKDYFVISGDDDQCIVSGQNVYVGFEKQKLVDDIKIGEKVLTATGKKTIGFSIVTNTKKSKKTNTFITIKTESGKTLEITDNHLCFVRPEKNHNWYLYLMKKQDLGYRIGITTNIKKRMDFERGADAIWVINNYETREEALVQEEIVSLKYGIPKILFYKRNRNEILSKTENQKKIHEEIDTIASACNLAKSFNLDLNYPIYAKKGVTRGEQKRLVCNICLLQKKGNSIYSTLTIETNNKNYIEKIKNLGLLNSRKGRKNGTRFVKQGKLQCIREIARKIRKEIGEILITEKAPLTELYSFVVPAKNLFVGALIPILSNKEIVLEKIINIKKSKKTKIVFDLEVEKTHNFVTEGIVTHNCVHAWAGSNPEFLIETAEKCEEIKVLEKSYRVPKNMCIVCNKILKKIKYRKQKTIESHETIEREGLFLYRRSGMVFKEIVSTIAPGEKTFLLFRTNAYKRLFGEKMFKETNIPFSYLGGKVLSPYTKKFCLVNNAVQRLSKKQDIDLEEALALIGVLVSSCLKKGIKTGFKKKKDLPSVVGVDYFFGEIMPMNLAQYNESFSLKEYLVSRIEYNHVVKKNPDLKTLNRNDEIKNKIRNTDDLIDFESWVENKRYARLLVELGTFHSSKGLEADAVVVVLNSCDYFADVGDSEWRCLYVACSRARRRLLVTVCPEIVTGRPNFDLAREFGGLGLGDLGVFGQNSLHVVTGGFG